MMRRVFFWKSGESRLMEDFRVEADTPAPSQTEELSIRRLVPMKQNTARRFERRGAEFAQKRKRKAVGPACGRQAAAGQKKLSGGVLFVDEIDDILGGCSGEKNFGDARLFERGNVLAGNDAADQHGDVVHAFFAQEIHELRADSVVGAGEDGEADNVDVFLYRGGGDHLRGLPEAGVDDFHAGVAEGAGNDLGAAVVAVEAGLGD